MAVNKPLGIGDQYTEVVIDPAGNVQVESHGYTDGACQNATRHMEQALGIVTDRRGKDDPSGGSYQQTG